MTALPFAMGILIFAFYWKIERIYMFQKNEKISDYLEANIISTSIWVLSISIIYWLYFILNTLDKS